MRILHILNHTRHRNGHVHATIDLACAQARLGHSVAVASGGGDFASLLAANNVETMSVDHRRRPDHLISSLITLDSLVRNWRADIIHAHMVTSALMAWIVSKRADIPLITTVHNAFERSAVLMGIGTRVIAVSDAVGRSMRKRGISKSRLDVVLNGTIGSVRFAGKERTPHQLSGPAIIYVGGLHPRKGLPDLLAAFDIVHKNRNAARLYIIGGGPDRRDHTEMAKRMSCASAVTFFGARDNPMPFLLGADIFVLPSHADPAPLVLSEARDAGCAIVASNVDGVPQLLEQGRAGILVPPRNPAHLAAAIAALIDDRDMLQAWKSNSQINLENLRIERVAHETMAVYRAACEQVYGAQDAASCPSR